MISTIAYVALIIGVILVALGYTVEPRAVRPGWGLVILAVVLILIAYLLPALHTTAMNILSTTGAQS